MTRVPLKPLLARRVSAVPPVWSASAESRRKLAVELWVDDAVVLDEGLADEELEELEELDEAEEPEEPEEPEGLGEAVVG